MKKRNRRSFSPEFKLEAVRVVVEGGRPLSQVARELQLRPELLRGWKKQLEAGGQIARAQTALSVEEENRRLKRENEVLRMERDFAKKAAREYGGSIRMASLPPWRERAARGTVATVGWQLQHRFLSIPVRSR